MSLLVLVIDETLGEASFVQHLLEELDHVRRALVLATPEELERFDILPDVLILGASWLGWARDFRRRFPASVIIGRTPWQGEVGDEFFPWGDELRDPTLPITTLVPQ